MSMVSLPNPAMKEELSRVAAKVFWWGTTEEGLRDVHRFLAQVMTYGDWEDVTTTLRVLGKDGFRQTLENAPPGVFDKKSWNYWHLYFRLTPVPPLPERHLP
jgi:hypothetical protein